MTLVLPTATSAPALVLPTPLSYLLKESLPFYQATRAQESRRVTDMLRAPVGAFRVVGMPQDRKSPSLLAYSEEFAERQDASAKMREIGLTFDFERARINNLAIIDANGVHWESIGERDVIPARRAEGIPTPPDDPTLGDWVVSVGDEVIPTKPVSWVSLINLVAALDIARENFTMGWWKENVEPVKRTLYEAGLYIRVVLTDGTNIYSELFIEPAEIEELNEKAERHGRGDMWYVESSEPITESLTLREQSPLAEPITLQ